MKTLLTPRWVAAHVVVVVVAIVFVGLGFWQLDRLGEVRLENSVAMTRYQAPPESLDLLLSAAGDDTESLRFRRVTVTGVYDVEGEVLTRNQVYQDQAGFHVITPLVSPGGGAVLVNRGWVPLELDTPPIGQALPNEGETTITGWLNPSQGRPALGPVDPPQGELSILNRIDIGRIQEQTGYPLEPVYVVLESSGADGLPVPLSAPRFDNEGNHLAYAIQWFGFTLIGLIGYGFIVRKSVGKSETRANVTTDSKSGD